MTRILAPLLLCLTLGFCATWGSGQAVTADPAALGVPVAVFGGVGV